MIFQMIQEGGPGAYLSIALGALGLLLGSFALIALLGRSQSATTLGIVTLLVSTATAGVGMLGTVWGRHQVTQALAFVNPLDAERILRMGFREAQSSSWIGCFAALVPLALGAVAALLGSRNQAPRSRVQGFAEPVVSSDGAMGPTIIAGIFVGIAALACGGAWAMAHSPLPKSRYAFDDNDHDSWALAGALDDVKTGARPNACERLADALDPFWGASDRREWPRTMRITPHPDLAGWRAAADGCAARIFESFDGEALDPPWTQEGLLESPLLQDEQLHQRAVAWVPRTPEPPADAPPEAMGSLDKNVILRVIRGDLRAIRACYERQLLKLPTLEGKLMVQFTIGKDGKVSSVRDASEPPFPSSRVSACVTGRFKGLRFPKPLGGGTVSVKYPFIFKSAN